MPVEFDALCYQRISRRLLRFEQERRICREVDRLVDADVFEKAVAEPVADGDDGRCWRVEHVCTACLDDWVVSGPALIA